MVARGELPERRTDLPVRQSAPAREVDRRPRQAASARALGHVAGPESDLRSHEPPDQEARSRRDLHGGPGTRRPRDHRQCLAGGQLHRVLSGGHPGRSRDAAAVPAVLDARRRAKPRQRADARFDPRRRRTGLRPRPRLRRGDGQPGPRRRSGRRRWRIRDGAARRKLEERRLHQPGPRWRRPADPAPERLQDLRPDGMGPARRRRSSEVLRGSGIRTLLRRRRRSGGRPPGLRCGA